MSSQHRPSKSKKKKSPVDPRLSEDLLKQVLAMDMDADRAWDLIRTLQSRIPSIFPQLQAMVQGGDAQAKRIAATILGQNSRQEKKMGPECVVELSLLLRETDPAILSDALCAMQHHSELAPRDLILSFAEHPDADVRFNVACAIGTFEDDKSILSQIKLSQDTDPETRSWATFGLGSLIDEDTPAIRNALAARLEDEEEDVRSEALLGLANLLDPRAIAPLLKELKDASPDHPGPHWEEAVEVIVDHSDKLGPEWDRLLAVLEDIDFYEKK